MKYAPVIIPTLCRFDHFKRCIESLSECTDADKTDVYIGIDFPKKDAHWDGYRMICSFLEEKKFPFKKIVVDKRAENCGAGENLRLLLTDHIVEKYETYIFTEDDNEFSPNFLRYINANLERYKEEEDIYAICGYNYPLVFNNYPQNDIYKSFFYSPWGAGFWMNKRQQVTVDEVDEVLHNPRKMLKIWTKVPFLLYTLISMRYGNKFYGDAVLRARLFLNGKKCIFPIMSKVRNRGYDMSGINCIDDGGIHLTQMIDCQTDYYNTETVVVPNFFKMLNTYYRTSISNRIKVFIKYFMYLIQFRKNKK